MRQGDLRKLVSLFMRSIKLARLSLALLVALLPAFVAAYVSVTGLKGSTLFLDNLATGAIKRLRLSYQAEGLQIIRLDEEVHFIRESNATLLADLHKSGGEIMLNLTLDISGRAEVHRYDGTTSTIKNYARQKFLLLRYVRDSYYLDSECVGMIPILVRPDETLAVQSAYFVDKGETLDLSKHDLVEIAGTRSSAFVVNIGERKITYYGTDLTREMPYVPATYAKMADFTSKSELLVLAYSEVSPKIPMAHQLLVENQRIRLLSEISRKYRGVCLLRRRSNVKGTDQPVNLAQHPGYSAL